MRIRLLPRRIERVAADERAVSVVEFAYLLPFLVVLVTGIVDVSQGLSDRFAIQQAVNRGLEMLQARPTTIGADDADVDYTFVKTEAAAAAGVPIEKVTLNRWRECDGVKQGTYTGYCANGQELARYVELRIEKTYEGKLFLGNYPMEARGALRVQ